MMEKRQARSIRADSSFIQHVLLGCSGDFEQALKQRCADDDQDLMAVDRA